MITRTEAIVLKRMNYGEASQIITLFTRKMGKISVLAKGARRSKSKFGATLQPLSYIQVVFYHKPTRDLQLLSETAFLLPLPHIQREVPKVQLGMEIVELTQSITEAEAPNFQLFTLLLEALASLNDVSRHHENILFYFQLRLATLFGYTPNIQKPSIQALEEAGGWLHIESGSVFFKNPPEGCLKASRATLRAFAIFARADLETILRLQLSPVQIHELRTLTDTYLHHHFETFKRLKTREVFGQMQTNTYITE